MYDADGGTTTDRYTDTITLQDNDAIMVPEVDKQGFQYTYVQVSVSENVTDAQVVMKQHNGTAVVITDYPHNKAVGGLRHYWIVMSTEALASSDMCAKAHRILGPMLPADCTFDFVDTNSPFLLNTISPPGSPLGTGAL